MEGLQIRKATVADIPAILAMPGNALDHAIFGNKAKKGFAADKLYYHISHPSSSVLTAWIKGQLVAFLIYTIDEKSFIRFIEAPTTLLGTVVKLLRGFYGYNPFSLFQLAKRYFYRISLSVSKASKAKIKEPISFLAHYAVHSEWRGKGIAYILIEKFLEDLKEREVEEVGTLVPKWNQISLHILVEKFGFEIEGEIEKLGSFFIS